MRPAIRPLIRLAWPAILLPWGVPAHAEPGAQVRREFTEMHMGVSVRVVLYAPNDSVAGGAARAGFARIRELEDKLSDYRPESEVRRLEHHPAAWVPVSAELFTVLDRALAIARGTGGAFDPTIGPVVALWREARRNRRLPDSSALAAARAYVGWEKVALDSARRAVRLASSGMRIDLGGIAKGYILEQAVGAIRARGVGRVLMEAGGDIVAAAPPPGRPGWRVDAPAADPVIAARAAALSHAALATSGPTVQFVEIGGIRYSHVVDPRTGLALTDGYVATVIAPDGATADALATALTVLGAEGEDVKRRVVAGFPGAVASVRRAPAAR